MGSDINNAFLITFYVGGGGGNSITKSHNIIMKNKSIPCNTCLAHVVVKDLTQTQTDHKQYSILLWRKMQII